MARIILASQSPRRKQLLELAEIDFEVQVADIDETPPADIPSTGLAEYLACEKAKVIADRNPDSIIIAADTVVLLNDEVLGKPTDDTDAISILKKLSGNTHQVISGVCIQNGTEQNNFSSVTEVHFRTLTDEEIQHYVSTYKPYDKAGAYAIQEWIGAIGIEKINGDYYNVMGLPINKVVDQLKQWQ